VTKWGAWSQVNVSDQDYYLVLTQIPSDTVVSTMHFGKYYQELLSLVDELNSVGDRRIIVKFHPRVFDKKEALPETQKVLAALHSLGVKVSIEKRKVSVHSYFPNARCVFACNSEAGIEAMFHGKPVITWGYPQYHWVTYDLRHLNQLEEALKLDWFDEQAAKRWVYWYLKKFTFWDKKSAQRRVDDLLGGKIHG
jgi:capsule polysaccharide export protein KpsC/LpsZ